MADIILQQESYQIMGACFEVYKELGCGFLEPVYQEALGIEFSLRSLPCHPQVSLALNYKNHLLEQVYVPDFVCFGTIIVELKAAKALDEVHRAQVHNYLKATGYKLGLLINFGHSPGVEYERIVR